LIDLISKSKSASSQGKFHSNLEAYLEQKNLYPIYPSNRPLDFTKLPNMDYGIGDSPNILFFSSRITSFAEVVANTLCVNPKDCVQSTNTGEFAHVQINLGEFARTRGDMNACSKVDFIEL